MRERKQMGRRFTGGGMRAVEEEVHEEGSADEWKVHQGVGERKGR